METVTATAARGNLFNMIVDSVKDTAIVHFP